MADPHQFPKDNLVLFNRAQSILDLISPHLKKDAPRILDIGAGYGHFLHAFREKFQKSAGLAIELSDVCVQHLQSIGIDVITKPVEEILPRMAERFDLVVVSHVLDHLADPSTTLRLIRASLVPGGLLYLSVGNFPPESLLLYPDHPWVQRGDEARLTFFSMPTLRHLLESFGFEIQFCNTVGPEYRYISSIQFRLPPMKSFALSLLPSPVFKFLRRQHFTQVFRVQEREESFYQYGGGRIWIRCVCHKMPLSTPGKE